MKTSTLLLLGLGGAAVWYLSSLGVAGATVQFVFAGLDIKSITDWQIQLMVQNVSNANLKLYALSGTVSLNGNVIGNISEFNGEIDIPAASQQQVNVDLQPSLLNISSQIASLIENPTGNLDIVVKGNANVNKLILPFTVENTFNL